jgi:hypothetical protein
VPAWLIAQTTTPKPTNCRKIPGPKGNSPPLQHESHVYPSRVHHQIRTVGNRRPVQNSLRLPSSEEKNELGRWRNTKALIAPIVCNRCCAAARASESGCVVARTPAETLNPDYFISIAFQWAPATRRLTLPSRRTCRVSPKRSTSCRASYSTTTATLPTPLRRPLCGSRKPTVRYCSGPGF